MRWLFTVPLRQNGRQIAFDVNIVATSQDGDLISDRCPERS